MSQLLFYSVSAAARAQLGLAIARHLDPTVEVWAAGARPTHVRPQVRAVLAEEGIRADGLLARPLVAVPVEQMDLIITLAPEAPRLEVAPHTREVTWFIPDPASAPSDEALEAYRAARDELLRRLPRVLRELAH